MAPIRVGLIGLSGAPPDRYEGVAWTPRAHLPFLKGSPDYEIVALLNSSVESAKTAIKRYGLSSDTKAYSNPEDLAADKAVDLVVCSVRVDRHFQTVRPSIIAGKAVFVEWPLERNLQLAREMTALAAKHKAKTMVGIQGSFPSIIRKMKELVDSGRIGKLLSSSVFASMSNGGETEVKNVRYFLDRDIGGNVVTIRFGHAIEFITCVLGEFKSWDSIMSNGYPTKNIVDPASGNKVIVKNAPNSVPDQIMFHGVVTPSNTPVTMHFRGGEPFPGTPNMDWRILGTKGEIRLTGPSDSLNVGRVDTKVELFDAQTGKIEVVVPEQSPLDELPLLAHNIARMYEAYLKGEWYPDFEWAVKRHEMIERMWEQYDSAWEQLK